MRKLTKYLTVALFGMLIVGCGGGNFTNSAPIAKSQELTVPEDISKKITLSATDTDGDPLVYTITATPKHGVLSGTAPNLTYRPNANFNGQDVFNFKANDGKTDSKEANVTITVTPVNDAPVAKADHYTVTEDANKTSFNVLSNDTDIDSDTLSIKAGSVTTPNHGGVAVINGANIDYTPASNFNGEESFSYIASDGALDSNLTTVTITVTSVNDAPVANEQNITTNEDHADSITLTASDIDGDSLTYSITNTPQHGTLSGTVPNLTYTPVSNFNGQDSFTFKVNDGTIDSNEANVTITVNSVNDKPVADAGDDQKDVAQGSTVTLDGSGSSDVESANLTYTWTIKKKPSGSEASLSNATVVNPSFTVDKTGVYRVQLIVNDGTDDSLPSIVTIIVCSNPITFNGLKYCSVVSPYTGRIWLDRNIGASRVCTTINDTSCYGDYYQWGRNRDGHEKSNSALTSIQATDLNSTDNKFIYGSSDWASVDSNGSIRVDKWANIDGSSVCPTGYRVPTIDEFKAETIDQDMTSNADAFNSFLKIATSGFRDFSNGNVVYRGSRSDFWTISVDNSSSNAGQLYIRDGEYLANYPARAYGQSIRCIAYTIINDNFDNETLGTLPTGWVIKYNGSGNENQKVVNSVYVSPSQSFQLEGTGWAANIYKTPSVIPNKVTIEANIYIDKIVSGDSGWFALYNKDKGDWGTQVGGLQFRDGKFYAYYRDGHYYEISTFTPQEWYHVKISYNQSAKTYKIYINGTEVSGTYDGTRYYTFPMHPSIEPKQIMLTAGNGGTVKVFYDDVLMY